MIKEITIFEGSFGDKYKEATIGAAASLDKQFFQGNLDELIRRLPVRMSMRDFSKARAQLIEEGFLEYVFSPAGEKMLRRTELPSPFAGEPRVVDLDCEEPPLLQRIWRSLLKP